MPKPFTTPPAWAGNGKPAWAGNGRPEWAGPPAGGGDDGGGEVGALSVNDPSATEGDPLVYTVTLDKASETPVTVDYTTVGDSDELDKFGTLVFAPGETTKTVTVQTLDDSNDEPDETVIFTLSNANGATIADDSGTGTIVDNDDPVVTPPEDNPPGGTPSSGYYEEGLEITNYQGTYNYGPGYYHFGTSDENFVPNEGVRDIYVSDFDGQDGSYNTIGNDTITDLEPDDIFLFVNDEANETTHVESHFIATEWDSSTGEVFAAEYDFVEKTNFGNITVSDLGLLTIDYADGYYAPLEDVA